MIKLPRRPVIRWPNTQPLSAPIPYARDPFVNTPLLRLTPGASGEERFWISSCNGAFGSLGVLVDEFGKSRLYAFGTHRYTVFYSVVQTGPDTLWLCGNLSFLIRLNLRSGQIKEFSTGAPSALVFAGMVFDAESKKCFAVAFSSARRSLNGFVFDTQRKRSVNVLDTFATQELYMRSSISNGDGTYSVQCQCPGLTFLHWDPKTDQIRIDPILPTLDIHGAGNQFYRTVQDDVGRAYLPGLGWYNGRSGRLEQGPEAPGEPATWFLRDKERFYGVNRDGVCAWNRKENTVHTVASTLGLSHFNVSLTDSGRLICFSKIGCFSRVIAATGELELSRQLPTDSVQGADCIIRIDSDRMLGTPFITQRFWECNLRTKKGSDCGVAAPGGGQITKVWNLNRQIYMAAYAGGELMRYDPSQPARFPENPMVVAKPPTGMRPVAATDDGQRIFYACNHHYGHLGSVLVRYDTRTDLAFYKDDPLPNQQIIHLAYHAAKNELLAGTSYNADCGSAPPVTDQVFMARIDPETLEVIEQVPGPARAGAAALIGPLPSGTWLGKANFGQGLYDADPPFTGWFVLDAATLHQPPPEAIRRIAGWTGQIHYANRPGRFVLRVESRIELWDMTHPKRLKVLADSIHLNHFAVQGRDLLTWSSWDLFVLENVL